MDLAQQEFKYIVLNEEGKPTHKLSEWKPLDEVENEDDLAILIDTPYVVFDFDSRDEFDAMYKITQDLNINTRIMKSKRGGHFWFKHDKPMTNHVDINTPLTLKVDIRSYGKYSFVKIKTNGKWREWLKWDENVEDIPYWIMPTDHSIDLMNLKNSDGRNDKLFKYIITLTMKGMSKDNIRNTYKLINKYVFADSLDDEELQTILRDDAFDNLRPAFFEKSTFLHHIFGDYLRNNSHIYVENNRLYMYNDGYYSQDTNIIEAKMIDYIPNLTQHQRREVLSYVRLKADRLPPINPYTVICSNGTIDIRDKVLRPHSPSNYSRNKMNVVYDENAYDETVDKVLDKISVGDKSIRKLIEEMIGYSILPITKFHKAFILYGDGSNGKSTLLDMISYMVGDINISSLSLDELNHNFKLAEITNKLVNVGDDIPDNYLEDSSIFKKLVTGDDITVDKKNEQPYKIRNYATMLFATNNLPKTRDKSSGFDRRLLIIPFDAVFSTRDDDYDPFIVDKLTTQNAQSYLLNLAIQGAIRLFAQNGFTEVEKVNNMLKEYRKDNNNVLQFLEEFKVEGQVTQDAYREYQFWCTESGLSPFTIRKFNAQVRKYKKLETKIATIGGKSCQVWTKMT